MQFPKTTLLLLLSAMHTAEAFVVRPAAVSPATVRVMATEEEKKAAEAVFVPPAEETDDDDDDDILEKAESLGRGAAKVRH